MALSKQPVSLNFSQGMNQKADPYQIPIGQFQSLQNSVFDKAGRLTKRNGFSNITNVTSTFSMSVSAITNNTTLTTLNDNLIATGSSLYAYSPDTNAWLNKGPVQPVQLSTLSMIRASTSQSAPDSAVASNGLICLVYKDTGNGSSAYYYQVSDSNTGEQIVQRTALPTTAFDARVLMLGNYFIITYLFVVGGTTNELAYIALPVNNPSLIGMPVTVSTDVQATNPAYDISYANNRIYFAWTATSTTLKTLYLNNALSFSSTTSAVTGVSPVAVSAYADAVSNVLWIAYAPTSAPAKILAYDLNFNVLMSATTFNADISTSTPIRLTIIALGRICTLFYTNLVAETLTSTLNYSLLSEVTVTLPVSGTGTGTVGSTSTQYDLALASKPFFSNGTIFLLTAYGNMNQSSAADNSNQPTYFLIDDDFNIYMRLAYANGGGYPQTEVIPSVSSFNGDYIIPYQITDFLATVNKGTSLPSGTPVNAIYTQTGINIAKFTINAEGQQSSEIAEALHLTGGQLWEYDGVKPVEHSFQVWPENVQITTANSGGSISAQAYYYVFTYEWTDNQGMLHRSAPSIPVTVTTTGSVSKNTIQVPNLTLTYKIAPNPVRIVGYRWSTAHQVYYQFTSITSPVVNDPTTPVQTIFDTLNDTAILGNTILYTTGGVVENIAAPASTASALFNNRLWLIDAEDPNLLWYSKQVIESVPVEMSDLLTLFVAPTTGAQGSTGPVTALSAMDDKLIIFKKDAIYYVNGTGPDNTGSNSQYSDAIFITAAVGCDNPNSIVLMPNGLMFQSDKGIWLLGRDLQTTYIGAPVEDLSLTNTVVSSRAIPATNQVRFVLNNSQTLMYDYFYNQWAIHSNISAISATLYQSAHTYLNSYGQIFQESSGLYLDGSVPVLMSLTTSWISVAGLQGYERFYAMNLLGTYFSPFQLNVSLAYNYSSGPQQSVIVSPDNYTLPWGGEANWGTGQTWGSDINNGGSNVFSARVFPIIQKCETFQVSIQEVYDASIGAPAGQGLSLSGMLLLVGVKRGSRTQSARRSFG